VLRELDHKNIIRLNGYGSDGKIVKPSGEVIGDLVYLVVEYVNGMLLFDKCQQMGGFGEDVACGLMQQLIDVLIYLNNKSIVHRDLKLENILVTNELHLKVADFGYATKQDVNCLRSYTGSTMYMAPEIEEGKQYDGF